MCTIAGYAGSKRAAPILIEMLRREQFMDGGLSTGIVTIHEGKVYSAKVTGDLDALLNNTNAMDLPGTVGLIHSRTANNLVSHAHPFLSGDGELAIVLNGTLREVKSPEFDKKSVEIMKEIYERGVEIRTMYENEASPRKLPNGLCYHDSEIYALMLGEAVASSPADRLAKDMTVAMADALSALPADVVVLSVHAKLPDTITIGTVTRPMNCGFGDGEVYLSTSAIAFPKEVQERSIVAIPPTTVAQVTPDGLKITNQRIRDVRVEQIDYRIAAYVRTEMEKLLTGKEDNPVGVPEMPCYTDWREIWSEPYVECKFASPTGLLKPYATILYEALWSFYKEGRLHSRDVLLPNGHYMTKFWLD